MSTEETKEPILLPKNALEKKVDVFLKQLEIAWENFERRRTYEWKLNLAIWTALAAFVAVCLKGDQPTLSGCQFTILFAAATVIVGLHGCFLIFCKRANKVDQERALFYEGLLNSATGACEPGFAGTEVKKAIEAITWTKGFWSVLLEGLVTAVLVCCACLVVISPPQKTAQPKEGKPANTVSGKLGRHVQPPPFGTRGHLRRPSWHRG